MLLGLVDSLAFAGVVRIPLGLLLFYARKVTALKWKSDRASTIYYWKTIVKSAILRYNATYLSYVHFENYRIISIY